METIREGYLELQLGSRDELQWLPLWVALSVAQPTADAKPEAASAIPEKLLGLFADSRKGKSLGSYNMAGMQVFSGEDGEFSVELLPKWRVTFRVPQNSKSYRKWVAAIKKLAAVAEDVNNNNNNIANVTADANTATAENNNNSNNNNNDNSKDLQLVELDLNRSISECALLQALVELSTLRNGLQMQRLTVLEAHVEECRVRLQQLKRGSATPVLQKNTSSSQRLIEPQRSSVVQPQFRSISALIDTLRAKGASPELAARHLYAAMGHRPHEEQEELLMSPATKQVLDSLPTVTMSLSSPVGQVEQLVSLLSKDDKFVLDMVREYSGIFLRLKGIDIDLAVRRFLFHFKLPKESQQIARVIRAFAESFHKVHAGLREYDRMSSAFAPAAPDSTHHYGPGEYVPWPDTESVEVIIFAIVMLNGDLHNPENFEKMTKPQFADNIRRSGAKVVLKEETLLSIYSRIKDDPLAFDNFNVYYPDAIRKAYIEVKVKGVAGVRLWSRAWVVLRENYDLTCAPNPEDRNHRSGGLGLLHICKSAQEENVVFLTFPVRRTVSLIEVSKREFMLVQSTGGGTSSSSLSLRTVLGSSSMKVDETRVKFRCKTDLEFQNWIRAIDYLLKGGYGFWYASEVNDVDSLDFPDVVATKGSKSGGSKLHIKQRKSRASSRAGFEGEEVVRSPRSRSPRKRIPNMSRDDGPSSSSSSMSSITGAATAAGTAAAAPTAAAASINAADGASSVASSVGASSASTSAVTITVNGSDTSSVESISSSSASSSTPLSPAKSPSRKTGKKQKSPRRSRPRPPSANPQPARLDFSTVTGEQQQLQPQQQRVDAISPHERGIDVFEEDDDSKGEDRQNFL